MIRRTLINRARRQRDLARTLIARHSLIAYDRSQPQLGYRPAALSDAFFTFASSAEAAAPVLDEIAPSANELAVPLAGLPEEMTETEPALIDSGMMHSFAPAIEIAAPRGDAEEFAVRPTTRTESILLITQVDGQPQAESPLSEARFHPPADRMQNQASHSFNPSQPAAPAPEAMIEPEPVLGVTEPVPASTAASAQPAAAADQRVGNTLADLVRRMRDPAWVAPEAAVPATTTPASAAPEPTANQQVADLMRQMQIPPQRTTPRAERPRIPLGQRMSEAADFGQTPATPHHVDPVAATAQDEPPAEAAERQPAQVVFEMEHPAAERSGGDVAHSPESIEPVESAGQLPIIAGADAQTVARILTPESPHAVAAHPDAPALNPSAPLGRAEPPAAPHAQSQMPEIDATPARTTAIPPSQAPAVEIANSLQNLDAPMALPPPATSDLLSPVDTPPAMTNDLERPATDVDLIDNASRRVTPAVEDARQAIDLPPMQPSDDQTQSALAAFVAAARTTAPIAPDRPTAAATSTPSQPKPSTQAQPNVDIHEPHGATAELPLPPVDSASDSVAAVTPAGLAQTNATPTWPIESESQLSSSEANTLAVPTQAPDAPVLDTARTQTVPSEIAQESQPASFRQPESGLPQVQGRSLPARSAEPVALSDAPISSVGVEPAADSQLIGDVQSPNAERASAPLNASESASIAPDHDSPQAWAARLSPPYQPLSAHIADPARPVSEPHVVQEPVSNPGDRIESQLDLNLSAAKSSADVPIAEHDPMVPAHDHIQAIDQHATHVEAHISLAATVLDEHAPALDQGLQVRRSDAAATGIDVALPDKREPVAKAAETPLARSSDAAQEPGAITAANDPSLIAAERAPLSTTLPSPNRRLPIVHEFPLAADDVPAADAPAPGSPQAWAARLAFHRQATEPQPEPTAARMPAGPPADRAPIASIEPQVLRAALDRSATAIADPTPGTPARFVPARRADLGAVSEVPIDAHTAATKRASVEHAATTTTVDVPAVTVPEAGSPAAWAARFARHREMTEPQAELNAARVPATRFDQPTLPAPTPVGADALAASDPGSPQAWAARLFPQAQPASPQIPPIASQPSAPQIAQRDVLAAPPTTAQPQIALRHAAPTPMAETTRRFLQPLVGIDPAEVRVFRGPVAGQVTAGYQAEALASGDIVALAAEHGEDTPATLGVLAHELTHIARQRDARFVPPLVRREHMPGAADEESLAQSVESQVRRIARGQAEATWRTPAPLNAASGSAMLASAPIAAPTQPRPAAPDPQPIAGDADWGGLPAPWDPLPQWFDASKSAEMPAPTVPQPARSMPPAPPAAIRNDAPFVLPIQLAETGRMLDALPAQSSPTTAPAQQPAPDLDVLARQVYAVLKQRLAAEHRRSQS